ncbi:hypothetical protein, partial [Mesorhizobium sp. M7A.F.Ca.CA.002.04.1.1]|uniref:hypothetical protein n=1 Tax=Mesorhizobium sp. M7A.F.Ca.CA.002.04.1.1 TaxID=2496681 RepID=UPI0019D48495
IFADRAGGEADAVFVVLDFLGAADAHFLLLIRPFWARSLYGWSEPRIVAQVFANALAPTGRFR